VASIAIPDVELRLFLKRRRRRAVAALPPLSGWLATTLDLAAKLVPSEAGSLLLDDPERPRGASALTFVAAYGPASEALIGKAVPVGAGIAGHVARCGQTHVSNSPQEDPLFFSEVDTASRFRSRSVVAAPIQLEGAVCGVLELVNRRGRKGFSERDVQLVELFAQHVSRAILNAVDILKQNELALHDDLTGVGSVRALDHFLPSTVRKAARRKSGDVALFFVDVDRLKSINDRLGHRAGSEAVCRVARVLESVVAERGEVFRFGGDEFVVVCPGLDLDAGLALAEAARAEIRARCGGPMKGGGVLPRVSASLGVASLGASLRAARGDQCKRLLTAADRALYRAKRNGRNRIERASRRDDPLKGR